MCRLHLQGRRNNENDHSYLCSQLIVSLLYIDHTTCFGYTAIFRCVTHKNAKNCYYNLAFLYVTHLKMAV
jgi:hypothetical protein